MNTFRTVVCTLVTIGLVAAALGWTSPPPLLLADDSRPPQVTIEWPTRAAAADPAAGQGRIRIEGTRPYRSPADRQHLGHNIDVYVALGGTRLDMGLGHPDGASIRVGLYKRDYRRPFFHNLADDAQITITLERVFMNQQVVPQPRTALMHVQYMLSDLNSCGLGDDERNLFNTADAADPVLGNLPPANVRPGILSGGGRGHGEILTKLEPDGSLSITWRFPYAILRHLQDPYQRTDPGGFFEPQHFHVEIQVLSAASPAAAEEPEASKPE